MEAAGAWKTEFEGLVRGSGWQPDGNRTNGERSIKFSGQ